MLQYFVEDQIGLWNWEGFANDEYVSLLEQARTEVDSAKRGEIYKQMQTLLEASGSFVFVAHEPLVTLHREGMTPSILPDGRPVFHAFRKAE